MRTLVEKGSGNAGGVRGGIVAVGNGVSVGSEVGVTIPAIAVCIASVMTASISGVGEAGAAGLQAAKRTASRPIARKMREDRNIGGYFTNIYIPVWPAVKLLAKRIGLEC